MAKCYITGLEVTVDESYLLDRGAARRAILTLKQRMAAVERLQTQLGPKDQVDRAGAPSASRNSRLQRRLVCATVATALGDCFPEQPLFISWPEFKRRGIAYREAQKNKPGTSGTKGQTDAAK